jgi:hypothetical protein
MKRVILESPYSGDVKANIWYARKCVKDSLSRGEAPLASHLLYTQDGILDDTVPEERGQGMSAGFTWTAVAERVVVYCDLGLSDGMISGIRQAQQLNIAVEFRHLPEFVLKDDIPFD